MTNNEKKKFRHAISEGIASSCNQEPNLDSSLKNLLVSHNETIEDKIATVKTAQLIDKGRVETAFKTLMKR